LIEYVELGSVPGGTNRNWDSYGHKVQFHNGESQLLQKNILADPQTSGGLLIAVAKDAISEVIEALEQNGLSDRVIPIGEIIEAGSFAVSVS
jgi:selenide,water dikinase